MKILRTVYDSLLNETPLLPPETGGIIGGEKGNITKAYFDNGNSLLDAPSIYEPNTKLLNQIITNWKEKGIDFLGIFHSHYFRDQALSPGDEKYIRKIMWAMPPQIQSLYFPIILPRKTIISYRASRYDSNIYIACDKIEILQNGG